MTTSGDDVSGLDRSRTASIAARTMRAALIAIGAVVPLAPVLAVGAAGTPAGAQDHVDGRVEIAWNRYYSVDEVEQQLRRIAEAYPELVTLRQIGESREGRPMWVATVNNDDTGAEGTKPAMWIDGSVHANEIQATEVVVYSLWYLTKAYGQVDHLTELVDRTTFHFMPIVNPDSRVAWFEEPNTPSTSRGNQRPVDSDRDGLFDEDPPNDLDGDGSITRMWRPDPDGRWKRSETDPRAFVRVAEGETGGWEPAGQEGIDDDGDGRINEDGPGGDDMNRNWPSGWKPNYVQRGAGEFPFSNPETRCIGEFIAARPWIAAAQSYHNTGGMILRGPGAPWRESFYTGRDRATYDAIARDGETMLPYYDYLVIHEDLYTVHGGFVNWTAEGLGVISFTNELWTGRKIFQEDVGGGSEDQRRIWRDDVLFGQTFTDYTEVEHPQYGRVLVGGPNKWSSRSTPTFMLEEECHRNFAFTMYHAAQMPELTWHRHEVVNMGGGMWQVTVEVRNENLIPTRTGLAASRQIGLPDLLTATPGAGVDLLASGPVRGWTDRQITELDHDPARILVEQGVPGRDGRLHRFLVSGPEGGELTLTWESDKARTIETTITLREGDPD